MRLERGQKWVCGCVERWSGVGESRVGGHEMLKVGESGQTGKEASAGIQAMCV